jgi:hypothetical protein
VPDETTVQHFRRLREIRSLAEGIFAKVNVAVIADESAHADAMLKANCH